MGFTRGAGSRRRRGCAANLAEEAIRSMTLGKLKLAVAMVLFAAVLAAARPPWPGKSTSPLHRCSK